MKKINNHFPSIMLYSGLCLLLFVSTCVNRLMAQDTTATAKAKIEPVKNTFGDIMLIDNPTVMVPRKNTFEFAIQHRFGIVNNGYKDFYGLFAPANMRLGFYYVPANNLMVGFGLCKERMIWDGDVSYAIMRQSKKGSWPVSITYYGNVAVDSRDKENFVSTADRFSYFNQLMVARKITEKFSAQASVSLSYFNNVEGYYDAEGNISPKMHNEHLAMSFLGRYKLTETLAVIVDYDQPLTQHPMNNPHPNIAFGLDIGTSSHSFQIFAGNFSYITPQVNNMYNQIDYTKGQFLIGFNITRNWNF
ncbi:MAG: DUF5777 family beta-barrel protein [Bacteroidia bacterium]